MNNSAAIGYMIIAAKKIGLDDKLIKKLESEMCKQMDLVLESEAERVYNNFY